MKFSKNDENWHFHDFFVLGRQIFENQKTSETLKTDMDQV